MREYCFIAGSSDKEDEAGSTENVPLTLIVEDELKRFKSCRGIPLISHDSTFSCPLLWWKQNHKSYPNVWELSKRVLAVPSTSAPSERVFSAAANVVDKKRVRLDPDTVNLLIYLRGNKRFVDWDVPVKFGLCRWIATVFWVFEVFPLEALVLPINTCTVKCIPLWDGGCESPS